MRSARSPVAAPRPRWHPECGTLPRMVSLLMFVLTLMASVAPTMAADAPQKVGAQIGNGETAVATAPPAARESPPAAMPRTTAQRLYAARPEMIFGVLVALMLITAVVLAIRMIVGVYRHR